MVLQQDFLENGNNMEFLTLNYNNKGKDLNVEILNYSYKLNKKDSQNSVFKDLLKINFKL